jgi:hypothetical protein
MDAFSEVVAEEKDVLFAKAAFEDGGVERHETVIFGTDQHNSFKVGDVVAVGQFHEERVMEFN